ncbi:MAG TPA: hypothetical protein VM529_13230 [Gemmata sp.]|nr:hypothetical protein [Gemmata sp.]
MIASLVACALLVASAAKSSDPPAETLIPLTIDPMPAPKPALRYALLPELREMSPGNPIPNYLKCLLDQDFTRDQEVLSPAALRLADRAARMDKPDWQILPKLRTDGIGLLLPDVQKMRQLANDLSVRFRDEVALRRFDDALVTAKTMFALSRHMGEHPTLIGDLVGIAIAQVAIGPLEEMIQQPGCPNLYWALTQLPQPFVSLDQGMQGERVFILAELRDLDDAKPMTREAIRKLMKHIDLIRGFESDRLKDKTRAYVEKRSRDERYVAEAHKRLVEYGLPEARLATFPAEQIVLLDERVEYEVQRDEAMKFMKLPTWEAVPLLRTWDAARAINAANSEPRLFDLFIASVEKVRFAQGRLDQRFALLRHVEAVRMYAARDGQLPESLADLHTPLPPDPFTGKPFRYELKGGVAHLRGTPPGYEKNAAYNLHYEITLRPK